MKKQLIILTALIAVLLFACKKNEQAPVPQFLIGHWTITSTIFTYNLANNKKISDTTYSKNTYAYYEFSSDHSYKELDSDSSYVLSGNFEASQSGNTVHIVFNANSGAGYSKTSDGVIDINNNLKLSYTVVLPGSPPLSDLPGDPNVNSVTTTQIMFKK